MTSVVHHPIRQCSQGFADFRAEHASELRAGWLVALSIAAGLVGIQPNWKSDVLAAVILSCASVLTVLRYTLTAPGLAAVTNVYGDTLVGESLVHLVGLTQRWQLATQLQPAWQ